MPSLTRPFTLPLKLLALLLPPLGKLLLHRLLAIPHTLTYRPAASPQCPKNIVVIGGSFAGIALVNRLVRCLPSGYRVVWVERNSHLHYVFAFPRFAVVPGYEQLGFIPYEGVGRGGPEGILCQKRGEVVGVEDGEVVLGSGERVGFEYLVVATGSSGLVPVNVSARERLGGCRELREVQEVIRRSGKIAVVGGGAVGVELAGDIKDFYPEKDVTLVHSRGQLLNQFGKRLQDYVLDVLRERLHVRVLLNERPEMPREGNMARSATLTFSDGSEEKFDLVIGCTGQRPNSSILSSFLPSAISPTNGRILVHPTLQVSPANSPDTQPPPPVFALGDVADHGGPHMARAAWFQAQVVADNILALIRGEKPSHFYKPKIFIEGSIKLTLGLKHTVIYAMDTDGSEVLIPTNLGKKDMGVGMAWWQYGASTTEAAAFAAEHLGTPVGS